MMLLRFDEVSLAYGHRPLLEAASFELHRGERVCLVGRNGEGKSSLLRLITGSAQADGGQIWIRPGTRIAFLGQDVAVDGDESVFDLVAGGLPALGRLLADYHHVAGQLASTPSSEQARHLAELQHEIEAADGWQLEQRVATVLSRLHLDGGARLGALSGGWRRRALLARALVGEPDLLLLDEPTNHLDIEAIEWLEQFLDEYRGALLFVSHDRMFVRRLAKRILDLDRGRLGSSDCGLDEYLGRKASALEIEAKENAEFDRRLAQEELWIRKGVEARRTRNEGRVRALEALRAERQARRERVGQVEFATQGVEASGKLVFEAESVTHDYGAEPVLKDFSVRILRGDRVGLIGPNGAGKTTLIRLVLGELTPQRGTIRRGSRLQVAYYDQQREQLDLSASVMDNVSGGNDTVTVNGRARHVSGYLQDFLFPSERLLSPAGSLSGGERNRLLLARLFARPANVLVLDEPTNDLDVETLELLEEIIADFDGTLLLVSHDRAFLDNVVTSTLVFEGKGRVREYVGGYSDWLRQRPTRLSGRAEGRARQPEHTVTSPGSARPAAKLSYKDQRELEALPDRIEALEAEQRRYTAMINEPTFYHRPHQAVAATLEELEVLNRELETCYARWAELEARQGGG